MLKVTCLNGATLTFDLRCDGDELGRKFADEGFQGQITSLAIHWDGTGHVLTKPKSKHRRCRWFAKVLQLPSGLCVGEQVSCILKDSKVSLTVYYSNRTVRCHVEGRG